MMSAENKHIGKKKKELVLILVILAVSRFFMRARGLFFQNHL